MKENVEMRSQRSFHTKSLLVNFDMTSDKLDLIEYFEMLDLYCFELPKEFINTHV